MPGRFHFNPEFQFEFSEISSDDWNSFFRYFLKTGQPCEVYRNSRKNSYREFSFHLTFLPEFPKFLAFGKFNNFRKTFSGNFRTICPRFEIFLIFDWMESAQHFLEFPENRTTSRFWKFLTRNFCSIWFSSLNFPKFGFEWTLSCMAGLALRTLL